MAIESGGHDDDDDRGSRPPEQEANRRRDRRVPRPADQCRPTRLRHRPCSVERCHRPAPAPDRPLHRGYRRGRGRAFRPRPRSGDRHTGRRPQRGGHRRLRRRDRHRPLGNARRAGRSRRPQGLGAGWCTVGGRRPRDAGARSGHHRRNREPHRSRRAHPRRWRRLADAQARPHGRQPPRRRRRDGRRQAAAGVRGRAPRPVLGVARRRRQLRRGHLVRIPPPPRRAHRPGRAHPLGRDRRRGGPPLLPRLRPRRSRRARHGREVRRRAAATGHPRGSALAPGGDGRYLLRRADRGR